MIEYKIRSSVRNGRAARFVASARGFAGARLAMGLALLAVLVMTAGTSVLSGAVAREVDRTLSLYFIHTKEELTVTYRRNGAYVPAAMAKLNHFLRDWRAEKSTRMDPKLIDLMWELHRELGSKKPVHIISAFRSATTNSKLRRMGRGVARRSMHIKGQAIDLVFPDVPVKKLRESALLREAGGVGYYPRSGKFGFVHIDTGNVRHWPRMNPVQLASLFKKKHQNRLRAPRKNTVLAYARPTTLIAPLRAANDIPQPRSKPVFEVAAAPQTAAVPRPRVKPMLVARALPPQQPLPAAVPPPAETPATRTITASLGMRTASLPVAVPPPSADVQRFIASVPNAARPRRTAKGSRRPLRIRVAGFNGLRGAVIKLREEIAPGLAINRARKGNLLMSTHQAKPPKLKASLPESWSGKPRRISRLEIAN